MSEMLQVLKWRVQVDFLPSTFRVGLHFGLEFHSPPLHWVRVRLLYTSNAAMMKTSLLYTE